jgi:hypothetical protein
MKFRSKSAHIAKIKFSARNKEKIESIWYLFDLRQDDDCLSAAAPDTGREFGKPHEGGVDGDIDTA